MKSITKDDIRLIKEAVDQLPFTVMNCNGWKCGENYCTWCQGEDDANEAIKTIKQSAGKLYKLISKLEGEDE